MQKKSLHIVNPRYEVNERATFIRNTVHEAKMQRMLFGLSGGIDSALIAALGIQALGEENIFSVLMPYGDQDMSNALRVADFLGIPEKNRETVNIKKGVDAIAKSLGIDINSKDPDVLLDKGNAMARMRMIVLYQRAKMRKALVGGTENNTERLFGYCTVGGDQVSDFESIITLYKTQVRQLAAFMGLPQFLLDQSASAGLWEGQTDEGELGFTYADADRILFAHLELNLTNEEISRTFGFSLDLIEKVLSRVETYAFKHELPYTYSRQA